MSATATTGTTIIATVACASADQCGEEARRHDVAEHAGAADHEMGEQEVGEGAEEHRRTVALKGVYGYPRKDHAAPTARATSA
jgi:hypothetical protein